MHYVLKTCCCAVHKAQQANGSHGRHQSAAGEHVCTLHKLGLNVCIHSAGQLGVPDETRLHSSLDS